MDIYKLPIVVRLRLGQWTAPLSLMQRRLISADKWVRSVTMTVASGQYVCVIQRSGVRKDALYVLMPSWPLTPQGHTHTTHTLFLISCLCKRISYLCFGFWEIMNVLVVCDEQRSPTHIHVPLWGNLLYLYFGLLFGQSSMILLFIYTQSSSILFSVLHISHDKRKNDILAPMQHLLPLLQKKPIM